MMHKAWSSIEYVPYRFSRSYVKLQGHTAIKNCRFWQKLGVSGLELQFEFTDGFEMMHKVWCSLEEVPYNFSGSSIKFWGHTGWKIDVSNPIWKRLLDRSQLSNPSDLPCCIILRSQSKQYSIQIHKRLFLKIHPKHRFFYALHFIIQRTKVLIKAFSNNHALKDSGINLGMSSASERRRHSMTPSLIDRARAQNNSWKL